MRPQVEFYVGQNTDVLKDLPRNSVHAVITSPPYWGLRDYGLEPVVWDGQAGCVHQWGSELRLDTRGLDLSTVGMQGTQQVDARGCSNGSFCTLCGAWRGSLGLEPTPDLFIEHLCQTFDAVIPILRPDGTCWVNLGDSYAGGGKAGKNPEYQTRHTEFGGAGRGTAAYGVPMGIPKGLKAKDLIGIPWRFAFAMQARGWYLRAAIPWIKRNVMPSSVRDRPTTGVEYVFLFAHPNSGSRYFYDIEATRVVAQTKPQRRHAAREPDAKGAQLPPGGSNRAPNYEVMDKPGINNTPVGGRNRRDTDWFFDSLRHILEGGETLLHPPSEEDEELPPSGSISNEHPVPLALVVNPRPFKEAHFAVFAPQFVTPMILASTSEKGCCAECGAPWVRVMERIAVVDPGRGETSQYQQHKEELLGRAHDAHRRLGQQYQDQLNASPPRTTGWKPSCPCTPTEPVPAVVLDPFGGSGTTALTSLNLGRSSVYIDASDAYCDEIAMPRIRAGVEALDKKT